MKSVVRYSKRPAPYRKALATRTIEELEWRVASGELSQAAFDWICMEREMTDEQLWDLRDAGLKGPAEDDDIEKKIKKKGDPSIPLEMLEATEDTEQTQYGDHSNAMLSAASGLLALLVRPTAEESCRYFLALVYHLQPEQGRKWGGMRGMGEALGKSAMTVNTAVQEWEELLGRRSINQKTETERNSIEDSRAKPNKGAQGELALGL